MDATIPKEDDILGLNDTPPTPKEDDILGLNDTPPTPKEDEEVSPLTQRYQELIANNEKE